MTVYLVKAWTDEGKESFSYFRTEQDAIDYWIDALEHFDGNAEYREATKNEIKEHLANLIYLKTSYRENTGNLHLFENINLMIAACESGLQGFKDVS